MTTQKKCLQQKVREIAVRPLELWGGVECTVNRVGDRWHDQLRANGHDQRIEDLDRFAQLGLRCLRYPVLWERAATARPDEFDLRWAELRLARLRELSIEPIAGLLHHGSGPAYTNLLDERFPELFACYASAVAARFPWITQYTPINEPLTTARFSALYGHWYPHRRDDRSFVRALLNQCRAIVLAMQSIRKVNSAAQLVQTDDVGHTTSSVGLGYQADFDNERRWLAWDLVCGRVDARHALWSYLLGAGAQRRELAWFQENACPPAVIGINHYVTSDRYLDECLEHYPPRTRGGNARQPYADVEAVRVAAAKRSGIAGAIADTWARFQLPIAVTEAHLGCTREEQLRWLYHFWHAAQRARGAGIEVHAVTVWALLGSFDWDTMLTRFQGHYEAGAFDVRGPEPRPTGVARLVCDLAAAAEPRDRALAKQRGWWDRPIRTLAAAANADGLERSTPYRPVLIAGAGGTLGRAFVRLCELRGLRAEACNRARLDICNPVAIANSLAEIRPWAVINAAGYARIDEAEQDCERCYSENARGAELLAKACAEYGIPLVTFSSDLVFDGQRQAPYLETDAVAPLNVFGLSKVRAERAVLQAHRKALVVRTSALFSPWETADFLALALRALANGQTLEAIEDLVMSPTYVPDVVNATLDLLIDGERGVWHLANAGSSSCVELIRRAADRAQVSTAKLRGCGWRSLGLVAPRPSFSALTSERGILLPELDSALGRYVAAA